MFVIVRSFLIVVLGHLVVRRWNLMEEGASGKRVPAAHAYRTSRASRSNMGPSQAGWASMNSGFHPYVGPAFSASGRQPLFCSLVEAHGGAGQGAGVVVRRSVVEHGCEAFWGWAWRRTEASGPRRHEPRQQRSGRRMPAATSFT